MASKTQTFIVLCRTKSFPTPALNVVHKNVILTAVC